MVLGAIISFVVAAAAAAVLIWMKRKIRMEEMQQGILDADKCVFCGKYVPEGRMVCVECEKKMEEESGD